MSAELQELKKHARWLEDELGNATALDDRLDEINGRLEAISDTLDKHADALVQISGAMVQISGAMVQQNDLLKEFVHALTTAPKSPPPPGPGDILNELFKTTNERKESAAKPKPRKPKLSVVPKKDGDDGPGAST